MPKINQCPAVRTGRGLFGVEARRCVLAAGHFGLHYAPAPAGQISPWNWRHVVVNLPQVNLQDREGVARRADGLLDVVSVFPTVQGEGPFAGRPATFVRLAGCNLQCPACFHANTQIRMADLSTRPISKVRVGDKVLSYDESTGKFVSRRVVRTMKRETNVVYRISTGGGTRDKTYVTGEHPFFVRGKGWTEARDLCIGDHILHDGGERKRRARKRASVRMVENNPMKNPEVAIRGFVNRNDHGTLTAPEAFLKASMKDLDLQFVGDGSLVVGNKAPDFLVGGTKKLIEVWDQEQTNHYGRDDSWMDSRRKLFEAQGYEVLFVPLKPFPIHSRFGTRKPHLRRLRKLEARRVQKLVREYVNNGHVVTGVEKIRRGKDRAWRTIAGGDALPLPVYNLEVKGTHTYVANNKVVHNCDTDYTANRRMVGVTDLCHEVYTKPVFSNLVVVTGGEPFRQDIGPFVRELLHRGYEVQIETNGTLYLEDFPWASPNLTVVCSPKTPRIDHRLAGQNLYYKYVLQAGNVDDADGLPTQTLGNGTPVYKPHAVASEFRRRVYVQPLDEKDEARNKANAAACAKSAMRFGYTVSIQGHKLLGVD